MLPTVVEHQSKAFATLDRLSKILKSQHSLGDRNHRNLHEWVNALTHRPPPNIRTDTDTDTHTHTHRDIHTHTHTHTYRIPSKCLNDIAALTSFVTATALAPSMH